MEGKSISLAKQATRRAVEMLGPRDQVGVIAFEDKNWWVSPLHACTDKAQILSRIDTIAAGGETDMYPALEKAYLALRDAFADLKHVIVLTDGVSSPGDFDGLVRKLAASGITLSTLAVGEEAAGPLLQDLAEKAKGHYYYCTDVSTVPKIFELETSIAGKLGITEEPVTPKAVRAADLPAELDLARMPTLLGYVETQAKPGSRVLVASPGGDPLLVWWRYGRGTSVAFTSDIQSRWAAAWLGWPGFQPFWVRLARASMRPDPLRECGIRVERDGQDTIAWLDALDPQRHFINGAEGTLKLLDPEQKASEVPLAQIAPGRYAARFAMPADGVYMLETSLSRGGQVIDAQRRAVGSTFPAELRIQPPDTTLLQRIAELSGGRFKPKPADLLASSDRTMPRTLPIWQYLLAAAAVLFFIDVGLKRIAWGSPTIA
jgi:hypothetical protein